MGATLPKNLLGGQAGNEAGHWEPERLLHLHEELLSVGGSSWDDWRKFDLDALPLEYKTRYRAAVQDLISDEYGHAKLLVLKDPRICRFVPFFTEVLRGSGIRTRYLITVRNPSEVAASLQKRDAISSDFSQLLYLRHVLDAERSTRSADRLIVDYDGLVTNPTESASRLADWILQKGAAGDTASIQAAAASIDCTQRHERADVATDRTSPATRAYQLVMRLAFNPDAQVADELDRLGAVLDWATPFASTSIKHLAQMAAAERQVITKPELLPDFSTPLNSVFWAQEERERLLEESQRRLDTSTASRDRIGTRLANGAYQIGKTWLREANDSARDLITKIAYHAYRRLPVSPLQKQRLSSWLAHRAPRLRSGIVGRLHRLSAPVPISLPATIESPGDKPLFSVVIPVYDRTWELRQAINSVLEQTLRQFELIIVTDGSPCETLEVIREFENDPRVRIFNYPKSSGTAVRGRNKGILEARAPYIAFLDSDDLAEPDRLHRSLHLLEAGNDVVYGAWRVKLDGTRTIPDLADGQIVRSPQCDLEMLREVCVPCQSTVAVRKSKLFEAGLLKPRMRYREDHELWARLAYLGAKFATTDAVLGTLRLHAGNNELNFKDEDRFWREEFIEQYSIIPSRPKKIAFVVAGLGISGGLLMVIKHAIALMERGHDVTLVDCSDGGTNVNPWIADCPIPVVRLRGGRPYQLRNFDIAIATFWTTAAVLDRIDAARKIYFVQSDERLFYEDENTRSLVEATYRLPFEYIAVADWIVRFLAQEFGHDARLVVNGVDISEFFEERSRRVNDRLRVLIEGPISVPFKGVRDAYEAVTGLPCDIWLVSSAGRPDPSWRVDRFIEAATTKEMREIYSSCDILLKMSQVESFCLPALEAMACGCAVVVGQVAGGMEFVVDGENALVVEKGDIAGARSAVNRLLQDSALRDRLVESGKTTAEQWSLTRSTQAMFEAIEGRSAQ